MLADHHDARAAVANFSQAIEAGNDILAVALGFQNDDVGGRRAAIGFGGGRETAELYLQVRLGHAAIFAGGLDGGGRLDGLAKRLDGYARDRSNMLVGTDGLGSGLNCSFEDRVGVLGHYLPISLIAPLLASG